MSKDVGIPGIAPEDVKHTPFQQAQIDAFLAEQKAEEERLGKEEPLELMESEIMGAWKILEILQTKYGYMKASHDNLVSLKNEADDRFEKIGLQVLVDWVLPGISQKQEPPTITIVGRLQGNEYNPEQNRFEVGKGVADKYYDMKRAQMGPQKKLIVPGKK